VYVETSLASYLVAWPSESVVTEQILRAALVPAKARADAAHIAIAAVHGMDYLLTWNCRHIANAVTRKRIDQLLRGAGYEAPVLCTPEELLEG